MASVQDIVRQVAQQAGLKYNWQKSFIDPGVTARGGPVAISAGAEHSVVLWCNGTVGIWGGDRYFQQRMPSGLSNVVALFAGGYHTLALKADGTVRAWGWNQYGQAAECRDWLDISDCIVVSGSVNPNLPGPCTLTYTVTDFFGHAATTNRTCDCPRAKCRFV